MKHSIRSDTLARHTVSHAQNGDTPEKHRSVNVHAVVHVRGHLRALWALATTAQNRESSSVVMCCNAETKQAGGDESTMIDYEL